jgi:hypothetical protein
MNSLRDIIIDTILISVAIYLGIFSSALITIFLFLGVLLGVIGFPFYYIWYFISRKNNKKR